MALAASNPSSEGQYEESQCHYFEQDEDRANLLSRDLNAVKAQWEPSSGIDEIAMQYRRCSFNDRFLSTASSDLRRNTCSKAAVYHVPNPTEMRDRNNRRLAHTHSVKENSRKNRFKSRQKLQNFKVVTGDPSQRRNYRQEGQDREKNSTRSSTSSSRSSARTSTNDFRGNDPTTSTRDEKIRIRALDSPLSLLDSHLRDPFETLPINSTRVDYLLDSSKYCLSSSSGKSTNLSKMQCDRRLSLCLALIMMVLGVLHLSSLRCSDLVSATQLSSMHCSFLLPFTQLRSDDPGNPRIQG